jgi:hypothetical protein
MKKVICLIGMLCIISYCSFGQWDENGNDIFSGDYLGTTVTSTYKPLELKSGGNNSVFINETGNVGIGSGFSTSFLPTSLSHIAVWDAGDDAFQLFNLAKTGFGNTYGFLVGMGSTSNDAILASQSGNIQFYTTTGGTSSPYPPDPANGNLRMVIKGSTGRVGIGTDNPGEKLQIDRGNLIVRGPNNFGSSGNSAFLYLGDNNNYIKARNGSGVSIGAFNAADGILLANGGNVGIGTTTPLQKLDVNGRMHIRDGVIQKGGAAITTTSDLGLYSLDINSWMRFVTNNQPIKFYSDGGTNPIGINSLLSIEPAGTINIRSLQGAGTRMVITDANGNLSSQAISGGGDNLGNHSATQSLNMNWNSINGVNTLDFLGGSSFQGLSGSDIRANARIAIYDDPIFYDFDVHFIVNNFTTVGTYEPTGWMHSSDERLKTNVKPLESSLEKILRLDGVGYNWKSRPNDCPQVGFIAQDVEKIFPEVIAKDKRGNYSMAPQNLVAPLVEAIKEQQKQIEELKSQIKNLSSEENNPGLRTAVSSNSLSGSELFQNKPNPFSIETKIEFILDKNVQKGNIYIYDLTGKQISGYFINTRGSGSLTINANELQPGTYLYTLIADEVEIDTRKMIITK